MYDDTVEQDSSNWKALRTFGADLYTDLNSSSGNEPSDGNWTVSNTGPLTWDIYHPSIQLMEGEGAPLQVEIQNQNQDNNGTPDFWVIGNNRVRQLSVSKILMKFDSYPKDWPLDSLVAETANWLREAKKKIDEYQQDLMPEQAMPATPPPGGGGAPGMPMAGRKARLSRRLLALERNPIETVKTDKEVSDAVDFYPSKSGKTLGPDTSTG